MIQVFPIRHRQVFTEGELERLLWGERELWDVCALVFIFIFISNAFKVHCLALPLNSTFLNFVFFWLKYSQMRLWTTSNLIMGILLVVLLSWMSVAFPPSSIVLRCFISFCMCKLLGSQLHSFCKLYKSSTMSSRDHSWGLWQEHLGSLLGGWHLSTQNWLLSARSVEKLFFTSHFLFSASEQLKLLHFYFSPDSIVANGLTLTCQAWWPVQITWSCHLTHQKSLTLLLSLYPFLVLLCQITCC